MKIKWIELTEDDPIFKRGFVISSPNIRSFKKEVHNNKKKKEIKQKGRIKKGVNPPWFLSVEPLAQDGYL